MRSALLCGLTFFACSQQVTKPFPDDMRLQQEDTAQIGVREKLPFPASGVSIDSDGQRYIWAPGQGVVQLKRTGAEVVLPISSLGERMYNSFEDLVIIDSKRLALIAQNEGIVVERSSGRVLSRFCYLPGGGPLNDPIEYQLSRSLGYDPEEDRLYVQPQTFPGGGTTANSSQLGLFDPTKDQPLEWQDFEQSTFNAGGMAIDTRARTYLGMDRRLYLYDAVEGTFGAWWELGGKVQSIDGLALDRQKRTLLVLDARAGELVELKINGLQ